MLHNSACELLKLRESIGKKGSLSGIACLSMCVFTWASCPPARAQMALVHTGLREHSHTRSGDHSYSALRSHMSNTLYMLLSVEYFVIVLLTARPVHVFMRPS